MLQLTTDQQFFVVKTYFETKSFNEVQNAFQASFPDRGPPSKPVIWKILKCTSKKAAA